MSVAAHSKLGASIAKRWINCPGSVALCEPLPERSGQAARDGTAAHAWAEFALKNGEVDLDGYVGAECPDAELAQYPPLTADMAKAVNVYLDHAWTLFKAECELHVERRFALDFIDARMFGTNDLCIIDWATKTLHVRDYKHGAGVFVEADDNPQLKYYALGALYGLDPERKLSRVTYGIVQPRAGGEPVRVVECDADDIWSFALELSEAAERTQDPSAPLNPGEWCKFCPAAGGHCKALSKITAEAAFDGFGDIADVAAIPSDDLARRLRDIPLIKTYCAAIEDRAEAEAREGNIPSGFKFVAGRGSRSWSLPDGEMIAKARELSDEIDLTEVSCLSPAKAEKAFGKSKFSKLAEFISVRHSKPSLVPESDKRPALPLSEINGSAGFDFTD